MADEPISVAVLGPGGVGGLLAALLARAGCTVTVLAGEETSQAIAGHGLRIESGRFGNFLVGVNATTRLTDPVDACFIAVKATQLEEALKRVPAKVLGQGLVIPFLNGLDHVDRLREVYLPASVVAATIRIETTRVEPGLIRHTSPFASVEIAPAADNRARVDPIVQHLKAAGLDVRVRDDELPMLWDKFALLEPLALLTTHERGNVGVVRTVRREDAVALIDEVTAVAGAEGVAVDGEAIMRLMDSAPESMESSMLRDQAAGRALELDAIGGAVMRRAAKAGLAVPVTSRLVAELRARSPRSVTNG